MESPRAEDSTTLARQLLLTYIDLKAFELFTGRHKTFD